LIDTQEVSEVRASKRKVIRNRRFYREYSGRAIGMYIGAAELVIINSLIVLLIVIDGIIRIGSAR